MRTLFGTLALATLFVAASGCYVSRHCCDPCGGATYRCTEFGFSRIFGGCNRGGGCDCATSADPCGAPCHTAYGNDCALPGGPCDFDYGPQYEGGPMYDAGPMYEAGPQPTFAPQESQRAPGAPTPMPMPTGNDSTGWRPSNGVRQVRHVQYPTR